MSVQELNDFLVYELEDSGMKKPIKNITPQNLQSILHSKQVLIIVRRDLKKIFIWKGSVSPVKKRFISSRVAAALRDELEENCRIISVDQGDEAQEFLNAFGLESMPATEVLKDMRYVRNAEKEGNQFPESKVLMPKMKSKSKTKLKESLALDLTKGDRKKIIQLLININQDISRIVEILKNS
ncbi:MAG: hypothetical protein ACW96X_00555 [Promethearchaeota archaeon]|jgi:hypothetical protein